MPSESSVMRAYSTLKASHPGTTIFCWSDLPNPIRSASNDTRACVSDLSRFKPLIAKTYNAPSAVGKISTEGSQPARSQRIRSGVTSDRSTGSLKRSRPETMAIDASEALPTPTISNTASLSPVANEKTKSFSGRSNKRPIRTRHL